MPDTKHVLIAASIRPRTGKTLLARLLAGHIALSGGRRAIFDTDAADRRLSAYFPDEAAVIDLDRVPDQMKLFDTLFTSPDVSQVVDLTHRSYGKFFRLMQDMGYAEEAKALGVEPVVFYIPDGSKESYDEGFALRERFKNCGFVLVRNECVGEPGREALNSPGMIGLSGHKPHLRLPVLDPFFASAIDDTKLSLSDFLRHASKGEGLPPLSPGSMPIAYLSLEARRGISSWLQIAFNEVRRALQYTDIQARIVAHDRFGE